MFSLWCKNGEQSLIAGMLSGILFLSLIGCSAEVERTAVKHAVVEGERPVAEEAPVALEGVSSVNSTELGHPRLPIDEPTANQVDDADAARRSEAHLVSEEDASEASAVSSDASSETPFENQEEPALKTGQDEPDAMEDPPVIQAKEEVQLLSDWAKPDVTFFITGRQHGYIEPCGCTGLTNQKGGLARRHTLLQQLIGRGWNVVPVDAGGQVRRFGVQPAIKFQTTYHSLKEMAYRAVGYGPSDLRLSVNDLLQTSLGSDEETPVICANAALLDRSLTPRFRVVEIGRRKIGITAVLGNKELEAVTSDDVVKEDPLDGLQEALRELLAVNCDMYLLLAHASMEESIAFAQQFQEFDVVVTAGGASVPAYRPVEIVDSDAIMIETGAKGMHVGILGVHFDATERFQYAKIELDSRFDDSPEMLEVFAAYQTTLKELGLEGLQLMNAVPHPNGQKFVGSQKCGECHTSAFAVWQAGIEDLAEPGPHALALEHLVHPEERSAIPRHHDPECLSCHVTGWNPQMYRRYETGYLSLDQSPHLHANGCENCHGPGSRHVEVEQLTPTGDAALINRLREEMRLTLEDAEATCFKCHDVDNSPDFQPEGAFQQYWEKIEHYGTD